MYALPHIYGMKKPQLLVKKNLEYLIEMRGTNPHELQKATGVPQPTVHRILTGESADPRTATLQPLADYFEVTVAALRDRDLAAEAWSATANSRQQLGDEFEEAPMITRKPQLIPVVGRVQAGDGGLLNIDDFNIEHPEGYLLWYATCPDAYALRIRGESMSPRYLPGEFAGVDPCSEVLPSDEVIVFLRDGRRMIKRLLWQRDGQACYESVNKDHPNIVLDCDEIEKMHRVTGHIDRSAFRQNI